MNDSDLDILEEDFPRHVKRLRIAAKEKYGISVPAECNHFLERCLRLKDFNHEKSLKLIKQFNSMMEDINQWDAPLRPSMYTKVFFTKLCTLLPEKDSQGRRIVYFKAAQWDLETTDFKELILSIWILGQYFTTEYIDSQRKGLVTIFDFSNFSLQHAWHVKHRAILSALIWVQNSVVARLKAVHVINHPRIISVIYSALKPFLKEKLKERIQFHGDNLKGLYKQVESRLVEPYLGMDGRPPKENFFNEKFYDGLMKHDAFFDDWLKRQFPLK